MSTVVIGIMAFFMTVGAVDKALFDNRFGYGREFERGLNTMGPLAMVMVGIMCAAPALGACIGPFFGRLFESVGSDPALFAGMVLGVDMGGLPLAQSMAHSSEAAVLSGIGLGGTFGCILTYAMPLSLSMCGSESRLDVSKGLVIGIIAAPLSLFGVGLAEGYAMSSLLKLGMPAFIFAATVAGALAFFAEKTAQVCLLVSRFLVGAFILLLAVAALENYFGFVLIPGMAPMGRQFELIGEISVMLAGAYPFVLFIQRHFAGLLHAFASFLKIDDSAALGMIVALANPLPTYTLFDQMTRRGRVICSAFSGPALCLLGDQLGFVSAVYPAGISALFAGKLIAAVAALIMALALVDAG